MNNLANVTEIPPLEAGQESLAGGGKMRNASGTLEGAPFLADHGEIPPPQRNASVFQTDEQLLQSALRGELNSFRRLVERYQRELFHFLVHFLGNRSAAEDTFQETFLQVYESAAQFDATRKFRPWLFTIAANKARDLLRAQSRRRTEPLQALLRPEQNDGGSFADLLKSQAPAPPDALELAEVRLRVRKIIASMPDSLREILLLSYFHQFPYKQISDILGIPLGTVKSRLHASVADFSSRWSLANQSRRQA